jgi:hypothetical protein
MRPERPRQPAFRFSHSIARPFRPQQVKRQWPNPRALPWAEGERPVGPPDQSSASTVQFCWDVVVRPPENRKARGAVNSCSPGEASVVKEPATARLPRASRPVPRPQSSLPLRERAGKLAAGDREAVIRRIPPASPRGIAARPAFPGGSRGHAKGRRCLLVTILCISKGKRCSPWGTFPRFWGTFYSPPLPTLSPSEMMLDFQGKGLLIASEKHD